MQAKNDRQRAILEIIGAQPVQTQQQLRRALAARGFACTQGTLSRDIKQLHLVKYPAGNGRLRYAADAAGAHGEQMEKLIRFSRQGVVSCKAAENLLVVKTLPGFAPGVGSYLDKLELPNVLGTLAGNDTVLVAMTDSKAAQALYRELHAVF